MIEDVSIACRRHSSFQLMKLNYISYDYFYFVFKTEVIKQYLNRSSSLIMFLWRDECF